ncbi:TetR/AcrR family transcriptional regulator C-terminal domain-containing protein [Pseudarthrobacter sp. H3Y2-7]|uniref:TetR/AcrR family transcriptional regulator C-terminal domain-containing protein n=1 Tax=Pseudarthrobacter naphthalenicus TaxID=3031328 RepID=UPI0023B20591|nr:TetR/AcrR family transcriptional regulator C-terminal domain-containing protein [Pseudarthrobacter sp. H3Y2-7]MDE8670610.1 TetR/AcrR family transcriptional regulator C-terminal domain-containing protein [Pseudarthrobacter sp. H3Y2-7]
MATPVMPPTGTPRGVATRARIRDAASDLFMRAPRNEVSVAAIAAAAGVYPNQITHHFGSKDALFIDAAFALLLRDTARLQIAASRAKSVTAFRSVLARTALLMPSLPLAVSALGIAGDSREVIDPVQRNLDLLFARSERFIRDRTTRHGWSTSPELAREVRTFWSATFGAVLLSRAGFPGGASEVDLASILSLTEDAGRLETGLHEIGTDGPAHRVNQPVSE